MPSIYKTVTVDTEVEIYEEDIIDYLNDLSDYELENIGYYREKRYSASTSLSYKQVDVIYDNIKALSKLVKFEPYSHEAILFERIMKAIENG